MGRHCMGQNITWAEGVLLWAHPSAIDVVRAGKNANWLYDVVSFLYNKDGPIARPTGPDLGVRISALADLSHLGRALDWGSLNISSNTISISSCNAYVCSLSKM